MNIPEQTIILDFDGTVADSFAMAVEIGQSLLKQYNYPVPTVESIYAMRELSASQIIKQSKVSPRHFPGMIRYVRREQKKIIHTVKPIAGIEVVLNELAKQYRLAIVSSSDASLIDDFLQKYKLSKTIHDVIGTAGIFTKHRHIKRYMKKYNIHSNDTLYIGDEVRDIDAARRAGIPVISVSWGFNGENILKRNNPNALVDKPSLLPEAIKIVLKN